MQLPSQVGHEKDPKDSPCLDSGAQNYLLKEYEQAWQHYRQNDTVRTQFTAFYFAFLVAAMGITFNLVKGQPPSDHTLLLGLAVIDTTLFFVTLVVLASITKFGAMLWHYRQRVDDLRKRLAGCLSESDRKLVESMNPSLSINVIVSDSVLSVQRSVETILGVLLAVFALSGIWICLTPMTGWSLEWIVANQGVILLGICVVLAISAALVVGYARDLRVPLAEIRGKPKAAGDGQQQATATGEPPTGRGGA